MTAANTSIWRNGAFRLLFGAQVISLLGSGVTTVGLALFAFQLAGGEKATVVLGNALMLRILAFLLFSQLAGVLADRLNRKAILVVSDIARCVLLMLFPFVSTVWHVYVLIFVINAVTAFFSPTFEASLPEVVGEAQYVKALAVSRVAVDVEAVGAPAIAALLVAALGVRWVFWFDATTYLVSAIMVLFVSLPHVRRALKSLSVSTFWSEISHGTRVLLREPSLRQALLLSFAEAVGGSAVIVVTVAYVRSTLERGNVASALAMAAVGLGSTLAALLLGTVTGRYEAGIVDRGVLHGRRHAWTQRALLLGGLLLGLVLLPGFLKPPLWAFITMWTLNGCGQALIAIPSSTLLAEHTFKEERGRAYAAHFALTHACWLITYPAVGHAAARWGAALTFSAAGLVCLVVTAFAKVVGRRGNEDHVHAA